MQHAVSIIILFRVNWKKERIQLAAAEAISISVHWLNCVSRAHRSHAANRSCMSVAPHASKPCLVACVVLTPWRITACPWQNRKNDIWQINTWVMYQSWMCPLLVPKHNKLTEPLIRYVLSNNAILNTLCGVRDSNSVRRLKGGGRHRPKKQKLGPVYHF